MAKAPDRAADRRANWDRVRHLYRQMIALVERECLDDELAGELALAMARLCAAYDREEELFVEHLLSVMHEVDPQSGGREERFGSYYHDVRFRHFEAYQSRDERRRPTPFEAAVETCRRLRDVNRLREQLAPVPTGCVLGGSASYGRFFNTVGVRDNAASDIDLILVVSDYGRLPAIVDALERVEGIQEDGLAQMRERADLFQGVLERLDEQERCLFSHKLKLWPPESPDRMLARTDIGGSYALSIHVMSAPVMDFVILRDLPHLDRERKVLDFRAQRARDPDKQRSFAGTEHVSSRGRQRKCEGGYLVPSYVCQVTPAEGAPGERYYPGQHQNLILPEIEIRWELESHRLYLPLFSFKVKLRERLELERHWRPYEIQRLSNSHLRRDHWAPYVSKRVNSL